MRICKAVIPVAGLGTRLLPATKVIPKELLPLVDKPVLQYIVEEAVAAGIEEIIFVTSPSKPAIEQHFRPYPELETALAAKEKFSKLAQLHSLNNLAAYTFVEQAEPLGLGHALLCARDLVGNEPFAVLLGDDLIAPETPCLPRMLELYERYQSTIILLFTPPREQLSAFGIAAGEVLDDEVFQVHHLVEKPPVDKAPSNLAVAGRYILTPDIFDGLAKTLPGVGGEIQLADAMQIQAESGRCYGLRFHGLRYDTGTPAGYLTTSLAYALKRPDIAPALRAYLHQLLANA